MIIFIFVIIVIGFILEKLSLNKHLSLFTYECHPKVQSVEPEKYFPITTIVRNNSKQSVPTLVIEHIMPNSLEIKNCEEEFIFHGSKLGVDVLLFTTSVSLKKHEVAKIDLEAKIPARGIHKFLGCNLYSSDFAGFYRPFCNKKYETKIIVYPSKIENAKFEQALSSTMGKIIVQKNIYQDPMLVLGYRDYTGNEPFKSISWAQTAKRGNIIVKEYDCTKEQHVSLILDVSYKEDFGLTHKRLEYCFSMVRKICEELAKKQIDFSFISNCVLQDENNEVLNCTYTNNNIGEMKSILELLGRCSYSAHFSCSELVNYVIKNTYRLSMHNNSIMYIATARTNETTNNIKKLSAKCNVNVLPLYAEDYCCEEKVVDNNDSKIV